MPYYITVEDKSSIKEILLVDKDLKVEDMNDIDQAK